MTPSVEELIRQYEQGTQVLRTAVAGMTVEQLHDRPVPGKWSTHEVICHVADAEMLYADRMKRVVAENEPLLAGMDPDLHVPRLAVPQRDVAEELAMVELVRKQMTHILRAMKSEDFQRKGIHSEAGALTLETLLLRVTNHIPHHAGFIAEKRAAQTAG